MAKQTIARNSNINNKAPQGRVDQIVRSMAHDFKEPLKSIRWYIDRGLNDSKVRANIKWRNRLKAYDDSVAATQLEFVKFYDKYKADANAEAFRAYVTDSLAEQVQTLQGDWLEISSFASRLNYQSERATAETFAKLVRRVPKRYQGLVKYLETAETPTLQPLNLRSEVERVCADMIALLETARVEPTISGHAVDLFDQIQISSAFQNVIANSIRFRRPNAALKIHVNIGTAAGRDVAIYIPIDMDSPEKRFGKADELAVIIFSDNGKGIPDDYSATVFEPFVQVEPDDPNSTGSGIGLSIVKGAVDRHEGLVWLTSTQNVGTRVIMVFPRRHPSGSATRIRGLAELLRAPTAE